MTPEQEPIKYVAVAAIPVLIPLSLMKIKRQKLNRKTHYWGALLCALPIVVVLGTGLLLRVKKQFA